MEFRMQLQGQRIGRGVFELITQVLTLEWALSFCNALDAPTSAGTRSLVLIAVRLSGGGINHG